MYKSLMTFTHVQVNLEKGAEKYAVCLGCISKSHQGYYNNVGKIMAWKAKIRFCSIYYGLSA